MIVATLGTFDLLHPGHLELLRACRHMAGTDGRVIVGLNTDQFVTRYKRRAPVQPYSQREEMLRACRYVDLVVANLGEEDSKPVIETIRPDLLAIGDGGLATGAAPGDRVRPPDDRRIVDARPQRAGSHAARDARPLPARRREPDRMIVIVPSRGRPKRAAQMVQSVRDTATGPVTVVVAVDPDDPELANYRRKVKEAIVLPERLGYVGSLNAIAAQHPDEDIFGAFGDDVIFRTPGWDDRVRQKLARPGYAFPNDLAHRENWPTAVFASKAIVDALGYLALPTVWHQYADNGWKAIGDALGILRYMPDVICEHMHEVYGKAPMDATYREVYAEPQSTLSYEAFLKWEAEDKAEDVAKVAAVVL